MAIRRFWIVVLGRGRECSACNLRRARLRGDYTLPTANMPSSPYVTSSALASLKQGCAGTDHLRITDEMLLWTPAEARRYFESAGQERPDPDVVARRSPEDTAPPPVRTGAARGEQEMISCLLCPCCDTLIGEAMVSLGSA